MSGDLCIFSVVLVIVLGAVLFVVGSVLMNDEKR